MEDINTRFQAPATPNETDSATNKIKTSNYMSDEVKAEEKPSKEKKSMPKRDQKFGSPKRGELPPLRKR